jgi:hypothetical protein
MRRALGEYAFVEEAESESVEEAVDEPESKVDRPVVEPSK